MTGVTVTPWSMIETRTMKLVIPHKWSAAGEARFVERVGEVVERADPADAEEADDEALAHRYGGAGKPGETRERPDDQQDGEAHQGIGPGQRRKQAAGD